MLNKLIALKDAVSRRRISANTTCFTGAIDALGFLVASESATSS